MRMQESVEFKPVETNVTKLLNTVTTLGVDTPADTSVGVQEVRAVLANMSILIGQLRGASRFKEEILKQAKDLSDKVSILEEKNKELTDIIKPHTPNMEENCKENKETKNIE